MLSAHNVAIYIINYCNEQKIPISNLKLQKLLYFVQGEASAKLSRRLIEDEFYARLLGPIVPSVYAEFAIYSSFYIPKQEAKREITDIFEKGIIDRVLMKYAKYSTWDLVEKSKSQDPWKYNFDIFGDGAIIPFQSIKEYFGSIEEKKKGL